MQWQHVHLGNQVSRIVGCEAGFALLNKYKLESWTAGGCAVLALALEKVLGGSTFWIVTPQPRPVFQHAVCFWDGVCLDADGAYTPDEMLAKYSGLEDPQRRLGRPRLVVGDGRKKPDVPQPAAAVRELADLLVFNGIGL